MQRSVIITALPAVIPDLFCRVGAIITKNINKYKPYLQHEISFLAYLKQQYCIN